jgi:hypothetical protein
MQLFYGRLTQQLRKRFKSLGHTASALNYFAQEKGMQTYIKAQNVDMWLKGSIPNSEYARVLELYMFENFTAAEFLEVVSVKTGA